MRISLSLLFFFSVFILDAQISFSSSKGKINKEIIADSIFYHIYNLNFEKANIKLQTEKKHLSYIASNWLLCELKWWEVIQEQEDTSLYYEFQIYLEEKLEAVPKLKEENKLIEMVYLNYMLRLLAMKDKSLKMLKYLIQINRFIKEFDPNSLKLFEKDLYAIYHSVFLISKNKLKIFNRYNEQVLIDNIIERTKSSRIIIKTTAQYFLIKIFIEIKETPELAKAYIDDFQRQYPNNPVFSTLP